MPNIKYIAIFLAFCATTLVSQEKRISPAYIFELCKRKKRRSGIKPSKESDGYDQEIRVRRSEPRLITAYKCPFCAFINQTKSRVSSHISHSHEWRLRQLCLSAN